MKKTKVRIFLILVILLITGIIWNYKLIYYGILQAKGQLEVLINARPVSDILNDPGEPDSLKARIRLVDEIKEFAVTELGLAGKDSYQKVYDQQGKEILWVVTACEPYQLKAKEWSFPIIGKFSYKGFFNYDMAVNEMEKLKKDGFDVGLRTASAWSTLGVFNDPIMSNLLFRSPGSLADVIIHEMTHATIFVKDSLEFNENLASFIGERGSMEFMKIKYGQESEIYTYDKNKNDDGLRFNRYLIQATMSLDSIYNAIPEDMEIPEKEKIKMNALESIVNNYDSLTFSDQSAFSGYFDNYFPNNTYFMSFLRYKGDQVRLDSLLQNYYQNDISLFIMDMKQNFGK